MKKSTKVQLYFGLDCGIMEFFYLQAAIQRTIDISPAFLDHGSAKKMQTVNRTSRRIRGLFA
jgi:hypothetical protein